MTPTISAHKASEIIRRIRPETTDTQIPAILMVCELILRDPDRDWRMRSQPVKISDEDFQMISDSKTYLIFREENREGVMETLLFPGPQGVEIAEAIREAEDFAYYEAHPEEIKLLGIDIETYSSNDLGSGGVYKYVEADDFTILLFCYSINGGPTHMTDLASGERHPPMIERALTHPGIIKTAFNAAFERICIGRHFGIHLDRTQWRCTMVLCATLGLPMSLALAGQALGLRDQKMEEGKALIRYFSVPCKPTKVNGGRTRNLPEHAPEKWATFKRYCRRDVEVEQNILKRCRAIKRRTGNTYVEWPDWHLDQKINDRGVLIDMTFVENAIRMDETYKAQLMEEAQDLTGLSNPNSRTQLISFLNDNGGSVETLRKADVPDLIKSSKNETVRRVLELRQELSKTSTAKYPAMKACVCKDGRVHGLIQHYGSRTGRWAGRLVQVQNLPQNHIDDLELARDIVRRGDLDLATICYGNVPDTLSQLIRTAFVAPEGKTFVVCDFSAIEARVIAWVAGETWVLDTFRQGGDIYCATASKMFGVPVEKHGQNAHLRQKGKVATLALGYGGGIEALRKMGGERMGLTDKEMQEIVVKWRNADKKIARFWSTIERAMWTAFDEGGEVKINQGIAVSYDEGTKFASVTLPSGRRIYYPHLAKTENRFGNDSLSFMGQNQTTKKWEQIETYGGKLTENIVQAIARDCLMEIIRRCESQGFPIVFHVHDEVVCEVPVEIADSKLKRLQKIFAAPPAWAKDLPLNGAGYITPFYKKD